MLRAIIIDDEQSGINSIKLLIQKYISDLKVVAETTEAIKGIELIENYQPDIVFLDIHMPHLNGFELLEKLMFKGFNLVFTTAHQEHALQALKNNAVDYLLKPIDIEDLQIAINKVRSKSRVNNNLDSFLKMIQEAKPENVTKLAITSKDSVEYFNHSEIVFFEADSNYTKIHLTNLKCVISPRTLKEFEKQVCEKENKFMRIHQSYIINLQHVTKFIKEDHGKIVLTNNTTLPLSKSKRPEFLGWLKI